MKDSLETSLDSAFAVGPDVRSAIGTAFRPLQASRRILLVSDDRQLRATLSEPLVASGFDVVTSGSAASYARRPAEDCDAAIVDLKAPQSVAHWLRAVESTTLVPTIAITNTTSGTAAAPLWNRVDAVLQAPFDARELLLMMRGLFAGGSKISARADQALITGPITLHALLNTATVAAREIALTGVETRVLRELMSFAGTPVARAHLTRSGLRRRSLPDDRCLDTHIKRLRHKLGFDRRGRTPIRTVHGVGYLLLTQWQPAS